MPATAQDTRLPFRMGTRQRRAFVSSIPYAAAQTLTPQYLPRVGMLSQIVVQFRGTVTLSGAGALSDLGPWNLVNRLTVSANIGSANIVDCSGYGLYSMQPLVEAQGYRPDKAGEGDTVPNTDIHAAPVAMGANTWALTFIVPISANTGGQFDLGLVNLQAPETTVAVNLTCGNLLDPATLVTATTGTFFVYYTYYEIPDPSQFQLPPLALCRIISELVPITQTGSNIYTVPRQGILLQMAVRVSLNGARSDVVGGVSSWDSTAIRFNKTDSVYQVDRQWERALERNWYGLNPIIGLYYHDLWRANSDVSQGDFRDAIDTEELTTLELLHNVGSGATLGSNNNFMEVTRRIVQTLE